MLGLLLPLLLGRSPPSADDGIRFTRRRLSKISASVYSSKTSRAERSVPDKIEGSNMFFHVRIEIRGIELNVSRTLRNDADMRTQIRQPYFGNINPINDNMACMSFHKTKEAQCQSGFATPLMKFVS
jgi:hypothetical protein